MEIEQNPSSEQSSEYRVVCVYRNGSRSETEPMDDLAAADERKGRFFNGNPQVLRAVVQRRPKPEPWCDLMSTVRGRRP